MVVKPILVPNSTIYCAFVLFVIRNRSSAYFCLVVDFFAISPIVVVRAELVPNPANVISVLFNRSSLRMVRSV